MFKIIPSVIVYVTLQLHNFQECRLCAIFIQHHKLCIIMLCHNQSDGYSLFQADYEMGGGGGLAPKSLALNNFFPGLIAKPKFVQQAE